MAHRISWALNRGPIPPGKYVCHDCPGGDNPACVNPEHLWLGTHAENLKDAAAKGMMAHGAQHGSKTMPQNVPKGESHYAAKLSDADVLKIREQAACGMPMKDIALMHGVSRPLISLVVNKKRWAHI